MVYNNKDTYAQLIVDDKKIEQQNIEKDLSDIDGNLSVCKGLVFFATIILVFSLFKQNCVVTQFKPEKWYLDTINEFNKKIVITHELKVL